MVVIVDNHRGEFLDPELSGCLGEILRGGQHMREIGRVIGDHVNIEKMSAGNMGVQVFIPCIAALVGQKEGRVENDQIGCLESLGQPFGRYQGRFCGC